ncbi:sulfotransferase family 2 domain-containing protein [Jannaschia ovalis]|uniref:Sulfotransferase family 2 domain-containing protein n=1 Tax=Jannaschia ovalis TaxID=3038773 RepID=A0ABY8LCA2_9RHOB|nr:sulfotransferase family 2 domain-containing protein [Jannaschia sp. GRR-S6-38]WGH78921.1 sulfotransferase family 2 domain-containing protein [Jannaschia sp. GRR-S6-38]
MRNLPTRDRLIQRARLYGGRTVRSLLRAPLGHKCVFLHMPKCGGTSVAEGLYATVPLEDRIGVLSSQAIRRGISFLHLGREDAAAFHDEGAQAEAMARFREQLVLMHMAQDAALIHGHFLLTDPIRAMARARGYRFVTILRDPVARTISNFRMARRNSVFAGDFDAFLDSAMGRRMAQHGLRFLAGQATIAPGAEAQALAAAKRNLAEFEVVGFLDDLDGFAQAFASGFGNRPRFAHYNRAPDAVFRLSPAQRDRLTALCAPDIALTEWARTRTAQLATAAPIPQAGGQPT